MQEAKITSGFPESLQLSKVFVGLLQEACKSINLLQFLFLNCVEIDGDKNGDLGVGDLVVHQGMEIKEEQPGEIFQRAPTVLDEQAGILATFAHGQPGISPKVKGLRRHVERIERTIF